MKWPSKPTVLTAALLGALLGSLTAFYGRMATTPVGLAGGSPAPKGLLVVGSPEGGGGWITAYRGLDGAAVGRTQVPWRAYADHRGEVRPVALQLDGDADLEVAVGLGEGGDGAFAVLDDPGHAMRLLGWGRVPWTDYVREGGATRVAGGDIDGDGRDEVVVGCSKGGVAYAFDDAAHGFAPLSTLRLPWKAYGGEVRPAVGDIDADGRPEVVLGLAEGSKGWMGVFRGARFASWAHLPWSEAIASDLGTWPSVGDVDGDGKAELVVGTGPGGGACLAAISEPLGRASVSWTRVAWAEYADVAGEARPTCIDLDADGRSELAVLLAEGTEMTNVAAVLDDRKASYAFLGWRMAWSAVAAAQAGSQAGTPARDERHLVRLKSRAFVPAASAAVPEPEGPIGSRRHFLVQIEGDLEKAIAALRAKGIDAVAMVGSDVVAVSAAVGATLDGVEGVRAAFVQEPQDRLDRFGYDFVSEKGTASVTVQFHPDVSTAEADRVIEGLRLAPVHCEGLPPNIVVAKVDPDRLDEVARNEAVAFVVPASEEMAAGKPSLWCAGMTENLLPPAEYSTEGGPGWDGSGAGPANLTYYYGNQTADLSQSTQRSELLRAITTWSRYVVVNWSQTSSPGIYASMDIHFGGDSHVNCPYTFGSGVLAHCFYPTSNPLGADMHINDAYTWRVGSTYDLYTVAVHESGHGLGLGHSSDPSAIMYPSYHGVMSDLAADDIAGIRQLYQTGTGSGGSGGGGGGGTTPPSDDYGNTPSTAAYLAVGGTYRVGQIETAGDVDFFYVNCSPSYTYRVWTSGLASGMDSVLTVYRPDGATVVGENDNYGGTYASSVQWMATTTGRYYARVRHRSSSGTGTYRVQASQPDDYSNVPSGARTLWVGYAPTPASILPSGDVDWFKFYAARGRSTIIETSNLTPSTMDTVLRLYNSSLSQIAYNDNASLATKASRITLTLPYTGWYYVRASHATWGTGTYSIQVR